MVIHTFIAQRVSFFCQIMSFWKGKKSKITKIQTKKPQPQNKLDPGIQSIVRRKTYFVIENTKQKPVFQSANSLSAFTESYYFGGK